ncbi:conserved unknown protein [Ectocarpus siliculosus]|uniref:Response regulatory domain-containing protein n=1 Tax=Ectocarpus siliculosus TaxID=2880 RepID=D7FY83_ECTSI|nr:conserved unknown protein [Ectocarpus siliculosus]|eukprot:CBJ26522.1 conserved unknown protein [Ectocarpus siliculosus]
MALEDSMDFEDHRRRQSAFSELLLRHLVTEPSLHVLEAGVKELFKDARIFVMHSDALEQIQDGVSLLAEYGEKALSGLKNGASELPTPVLEKADMEEILDACLRTTAYLAVSRDHHKVQLDLRVAADVDKSVKTYRLWLSQMTRACLIHALHPDEDDSVILRVSYARPGLMRVGIEAVWRVAGSREGGGGSGGDGTSADQREAPRVLSGWDRDMPAAAWWVRAAALALGGEADYDRSRDREGFHELWFTIPAENVPDDDDLELDTPVSARDTATAAAAAAAATGGEGPPAELPDAGASSVLSTRGGSTSGRTRSSRLGEIDKQGEGSVSSTAAGADEERGGLDMTAPRAARRESSRNPTLEPLSSAHKTGATGAGAAALPRPGAMAASPTFVNPSPRLSSSAPSSLHGLPAAKKRGTILPAIQDTEISLEGSQTTNVMEFDSDDRARSSRKSVGGAGGTDRNTIGHGYRSSLGGTIVGSSGRGKSVSARPNVPRLEDIRVSRVATDCGFNPDEHANRRPSSAPDPTAAAAAWSGETNIGETTAAASVATTSTPVDRISRSSPNSPKRFAAGGERTSKRRSLSITVRNLLGTEGGLDKLRESLQEDEANPGKAAAAAEEVRGAMRKTAAAGDKGNVSMHKHEAVARAAGQGAAGMAAARLTSGLFLKRPSSAPSPAAAVTKKASVFGGLVQTLVESNSMNWLGTGKVASNISEEREGDTGDSEEDTEESEQTLEILLVDPQGLVRWALPRLKERNFFVTVAHSAEEAMDMILEGYYQVAVVDLHMPRMSGTEFCRRVRAHELEVATSIRSMNTSGRAGQEGEELNEPGPSTKLLLHTTSAGSVTFDDLEAFLEEDLVDEYVPHPLDLGTLFDFLKLFEEEDDQYGTRKMSALLEGGADKSNGGDSTNTVSKYCQSHSRRKWLTTSLCLLQAMEPPYSAAACC